MKKPMWRNWQTRWTQNPLIVKIVWVRLPPSALLRICKINLCNMESYEKILLSGLGLVSMSEKEFKKMLQMIAGRTPTKKELDQFLAAILKEGKAKQQKSAKQAKAAVKKILEELDIPTRSELKALEKKLSQYRGK